MGSCAGAHCIPCLWACKFYDANTQVMTANGTEVAAESLKAGDFIHTLDEQNEQMLTEVIFIKVMEGNFTGVSLQTSVGTLTATEGHFIYRAVSLVDQKGNFSMEAIAAASVNAGDFLLGSGHLVAVESAKQVVMKKKVHFVTRSCSALTGGVLTDTCGSAFNTVKGLSPAPLPRMSWRLKEVTA